MTPTHLPRWFRVFILTALAPLSVGACISEDPSFLGGSGRCGGRADPNFPSSALSDEAWPASAIELEDSVLELTNAARAEERCCGSRCFSATAPLRKNSNLVAAARYHAQDMAERDYFAHDSRDGRTSFDRMRAAGYDGCAMGENIAMGHPTPEAVVEGWLKSEGHCRNIMEPSFRELGVGFVDPSPERSDELWVQNFGG